MVLAIARAANVPASLSHMTKRARVPRVPRVPASGILGTLGTLGTLARKTGGGTMLLPGIFAYNQECQRGQSFGTLLRKTGGEQCFYQI
jgi:hypothetical protein